MKAYNLYAVNDLRYEDMPIPACPSGWAVVKVKAAGICSSDIPRIFTKGTYHFPTVPGHEFSGIVHSVSDESHLHLLGKHVGVFPLIPCRKCNSCVDKHYEMCEHYDYIGSRRDGAFAEFVAVPVWNMIEIPDNLSFEVAAMLEPFSVALHAVKLGTITKRSSVAIVGTGMIGIAAGQWARTFGADKVVVFGRSEDKRTMIENCGLDYIIDLNDKYCDMFDLVIEAVGTPNSIESALNITRRGGELILLGNPCGDINLKQSVYWKILRKQLKISGTWNSSFDGVNTSDWTEAINALANNVIEAKPLITHMFTQERLKDGLQLMKDHREPYCKVMSIWNK